MARICILTLRMLRGWGVDHVVHRTADGLARRGHEVDVICLYADRSYASRTYRVRVLELPSAPIEALEETVLARPGLILQRSYDMFIAAMYPFFRVAGVLELPYVYWEFGVVDPVGLPAGTRAHLDRIRRDAQEHQLRARRVAAISRFLIEEQVNPTRRSETDITYLGAESYGPPRSDADVRAFRARLGIEPDAEVIGYVGRIERSSYKGVDELAEIAALVRARRPRARLLLVGHAEDAADAHFAALPAVQVCTDVPDADMPLYFGAMDVVVSASRWEGFNLGLAEGQFYARPAVAYRLGAHPEIVAPAGMLVASRGEFVGALETLLADRETRQRKGVESQRFVDRFTWAGTVDAMERCLGRAGLAAAVARDPLLDLATLSARPARRTAVTIACGSNGTAPALAEAFEQVVAVERTGATIPWVARPPRLTLVRSRTVLGHLSPDRPADLIVAGADEAPVAAAVALPLLREGLRALAWGGVLVVHVGRDALAPAAAAEIARGDGARLASVFHDAWGARLCVVRDAAPSALSA